MTAVLERRFVLPADVELREAPDSHGTQDVVVIRHGSRERPRAVSAQTAALLDLFRTPTALVDAVLAHSTAVGEPPEETLEQAFPVLVALCQAELLAEEGTESAQVAHLRQVEGDRVGPARLTGLVRALRDSEVWRGCTADGEEVAIKVLADGPLAAGLATREAEVLRHLDGDGAPALLHAETSASQTPEVAARLVIGWADGDPADLVARQWGDPVDGAAARRRLAADVAQQYASLHERGVLHGDVHAGNVLVGPDGVTLIDFGLARFQDGRLDPTPRAAGGAQLEPEAARALLAGEPAPAVTPTGEQYAVAVLLWRLLTDEAPLELASERSVALEQVLRNEPRTLMACGAPAWPAGEVALRRAMAKNPDERFPSVRAFADALAAALSGPDQRSSRRPDVRPAVLALDVGTPAWRETSAAGAAVAAEFLRGVAIFTSDPEAADLAALWAARAGVAQRGPVVPAVLQARERLAAYRLTGDERELRRARALARSLPGPPAHWTAVMPGLLDLGGGPLARVLLLLECADPYLAGCISGPSSGS